MVLRSFNSLSENRLSCSAEVPLKKPGWGEQKASEHSRRIPYSTAGLTSVCHFACMQETTLAVEKNELRRPWELKVPLM